MCHIIVTVYVTHLKGHLEIPTLTSWYQHWHCQSFFSSHIFFWKNKAFMINVTLVSLCFDYSFLHDLFSSIQRHPLVFWKKGCLNFWSNHPLAFRKDSCNENFAKLPNETIHFAVLNSSTFANLLGVQKTTCLKRLMYKRKLA